MFDNGNNEFALYLINAMTSIDSLWSITSCVPVALVDNCVIRVNDSTNRKRTVANNEHSGPFMGVSGPGCMYDNTLLPTPSREVM